MIKTISYYYCDICGKEIDPNEKNYLKDESECDKLVLPMVEEYIHENEIKYRHKKFVVKQICDICYLNLCDYVEQITPQIIKSFDCRTEKEKNNEENI